MRLLVVGMMLLAGIWQGPLASQKTGPGTGDKIATSQPEPGPTYATVVNPDVQAAPGQPEPPNQKPSTGYDVWSWYLQPAWMIVWVTIVYAFISWRMLIAIKRQAKIMDVQVRATWAAQRPHLSCESNADLPEMVLSDTPRVTVQLDNRGSAPAYGVSYESWIGLSRSPDDWRSDGATYFKGDNAPVLYPNSRPMEINIPLQRQLTPSERQDIGNNKLFVCFRVRATFRDDHTKGRYADFGFFVRLDGYGILPRYNDAN